MHGRPREYKNKLKADPKAQEAYEKKVDAIRNGTAMVLEFRRKKKYDQPVLDAAAKLLKVVPEIYTLWNYRREALAPAFEAGGAAAQAASNGELALTAACLQENPKSYSTWHHRKWVVAQGLCSLDKELALISKALDEDQRNFHAWNYRQFIVRRMGRSAQDELQYTEEKIIQNFSNYSAWHFRTILLHKLYGGGDEQKKQQQPEAEAASEAGAASTGAGASPVAPVAAPAPTAAGSASQRTPIPHEVLDAEYDMVHQAFATDSKDESPWVYYRWLVGNTLAHLPHSTTSSSGAQGAQQHQQPGQRGDGPDRPQGEGVTGPGGAKQEGQEQEGEAVESEDAAEARARVAAVLEREVSRLQEDHLAADPDARRPLLMLARIKEAQARLGLAASPAEGEALLQEARAAYGRLMELDPLRRGYYQDAMEGRAFVVVQALGTV